MLRLPSICRLAHLALGFEIRSKSIGGGDSSNDSNCINLIQQFKKRAEDDVSSLGIQTTRDIADHHIVFKYARRLKLKGG